MHIKRLVIENYKSFSATTKFEFEPGFNILLGANSSGKTTVLESIEYQHVQNEPHRSEISIPEVGVQPAPYSRINISFEVAKTEILKTLAPQTSFILPIGNEDNTRFFTEDPQLLLKRFNTDPLHLEFKRHFEVSPRSRLYFPDWVGPWLQVDANNSALAARYSVATGEFDQFSNCGFSTEQPHNFMWGSIAHKIYRFSSERRIQAISPHSSVDLASNSENLAFCINHLQSTNSSLFEKLNQLLNRVFPTIHWVAAPPNGSGQFELKVHSSLPIQNRGDLAVPINRVGTGIGNALAMLYVALTAQTQRFILLEEPNSFLHPRALRELLAILAEEGGKHQFFITTHSSDVLRTVNASTVTLLEHDGQQTTIKQTTGKKLHELKAGLVHLGISLTDLHGCDRVLWVEGETEEAIFPILLRTYFPDLAQGIAVLPLYATGDFDSRKYEPKKVAAIYKQLSEGSFLAPPMVGIALDRERRKDSEISQAEKDCAGIVHFLPKTMLEDYLLDSEGIAAVLVEDADSTITLEQVTTALAEAKASTECLLNSANPTSKDLHAAKVLHFVFQKLGTLEYRKTDHGPKIVEWLLANKPNELIPLKNWFVSFLRPPA